MTKYIIIPEYRPLYAMRYCFGPTHGPLDKPCPTPVDVIGKLLLQTGAEKLSIFEVKYDALHHKVIGEPVQLTLANYRKPYDEIVGKKEDTSEVTTESIPEPSVVIKPTVADNKESESVSPEKEETLVETKNAEEIPEVEPDETDKKTIQETVVVTTATSADGTVTSNNTVFKVPETPVDAPFVTGTVVGNVKEPNEFVTTSSEDTYMVPVTTAEGTKMIDTGMTEAEYKALSKSERRRLRKTLANESEEDISDDE